MEASHRYQYALKKVNNVINDPITTGAPLSSEHLCTFTQLKTNFLLNHSRCKRKLNVSIFYVTCFSLMQVLINFYTLLQEFEESLDLAAQAISLRPDSFECYYARSKSLLALEKFNESLQDVRKALLLTPQNNVNVKKILSSLQQEILNKITNKNVSARERNLYDTLSLNLP